MNGLTLLGLIGMGWLAFSVIFGVSIGRGLARSETPGEQRWRGSPAAHPAPRRDDAA